MPHLPRASGANVYYEEFGAGPPILFVSAGLATHAEWEHQVAPLARDHRMVTFDWPGVGGSDKPNIRYTGDVLVDAIKDLVETLELDRCTVVAHGIGAHGALLAAERHPDLVDRLVLVGSGPWYGGDRDGVAGGFSAEFIAWWQEQTSSTTATAVEAYAALGREFLFAEAPAPEVLDWFVAGALQWPLHVFNSYCADMADLDHRERLLRIRQRTLIVQGRHDRKQRYEGAKVLHELLPHSELRTFENSAHMVNVEEIADFNETLRAFVAG